MTKTSELKEIRLVLDRTEGKLEDALATASEQKQEVTHAQQVIKELEEILASDNQKMDTEILSADDIYNLTAKISGLETSINIQKKVLNNVANKQLKAKLSVKLDTLFEDIAIMRECFSALTRTMLKEVSVLSFKDDHASLHDVRLRVIDIESESSQLVAKNNLATQGHHGMYPATDNKRYTLNKHPLNILDTYKDVMLANFKHEAAIDYSEMN